MSIEEKSIITLEDDKRYVISKKVNNKGRDYYFAINIADSSDFKFFYIEGDELVEIFDEQNIADLIVLFKIHITEDITSD